MILLYQQNTEFVNTEDLCVGCGCSMHHGKPFLREEHGCICFNGILVGVSKEEMEEFKKSIKEYDRG